MHHQFLFCFQSQISSNTIVAFNLKIFDDLARAFSDELPPDLGNLDGHVDYILKHVRPYGEDLHEAGGKFWLSKRWKEIRDDATFHESILHIFNPEGEYMISVDGNIGKGGWRTLNSDNTLILEFGGRSELFDLAFLNPDFMILKKHGDQTRKNLRKYIVFVKEGTAKDIDWRNLMELLYNVYRSDSQRYISWVLFIVVVIAIVLVLSLY